ncbi:MAG TPA: VWA domain-containing protein [Pirellulaceae bacterium]|nr:VWA domain-containing protein [Pirellulaceae bacterium]
MKLRCVHCGNDFSITAEQLGGRGRCPHCRASIVLPRADEMGPSEPEALEPPSRLMENVIGGLGSCALHLIILILVGLVRWGGEGMAGAGIEEEVMIGEMPFTNLTQQLDEAVDLEASEVAAEAAGETTLVEITTPDFAGSDAIADVTELSPTAGVAFGTGTEFDSADVARAASGGGAEDFDGLIQRLRRDGLDVVIVFDSTGSMSGEIDTVKQQIERIGSVLMQLVPKTRISLCTYRDDTDEYVVKGLPLAGSISTIRGYLNSCGAGGGGDHPEAVHAGLDWAINKNRFTPRARKVILLFGDAPPHAQQLGRCLDLAEEFRQQHGGIVSTVTCRATRRMDEFIEIAQAGGGEAFLTSNEREIMTQLIVLVFGSQHRDKVLEAFELLGR